MIDEEYRKITQHAVDLIKATNSVIGLNIDPDMSQMEHDTKAVLSSLRVMKTHMEDMMDKLEYQARTLAEEKEYRKFLDRCGSGEAGTVKWSEIPQKAKDELIGLYRKQTSGVDSVTKEQSDGFLSKADNDFQNAMNTAVLKAYMAGAQWADETMIEKARNWIEDNITSYFGRSDYIGQEFTEAMEE